MDEDQLIADFVERLEYEIDNIEIVKAIAMIDDEANSELINASQVLESIVQYLSEENNKNSPELWECGEAVLIALAKKCRKDDFILGILEAIDSADYDETVVSVLKAMYECLKRPDEDLSASAQRLEWSLNSIQIYTSELPVPEELRNHLEKEEEQLLEEIEDIRRIIKFHFYVCMFFKDIMEKVLGDEPSAIENNFRITSLSSRVVLTCFLIQLFDKPFAYLDFTDPAELQSAYTNSQTRTILEHITEGIATLVPDPFSLLRYGERRARWPYAHPDPNDFYAYSAAADKPLTDFFLIEEKAPTSAMGIMFYAMFVEKKAPPTAPKIYDPVYLFEMGLYFVTNLLSSGEETFYHKGLLLCIHLLENTNNRLFEDEALDLDIHFQFTKRLVRVLDKTSVRRNSEDGISLLRSYLKKFRTIGPKYGHIQSMLQVTENYKIRSLLVTMYKDIIASELSAVEHDPYAELSMHCKGKKLKEIMMGTICIMPKGVETDILQHNDLIVSTLNTLIFLCIRDTNNHTQIWNFINEVQETYLTVLEKAIHLTGAHYRLEEKRIKENASNDRPVVELANAPFMQMTNENRLHVIQIGQNTFHLIETLLSRLNEIIEQRNINLRQNNQPGTSDEIKLEENASA